LVEKAQDILEELPHLACPIPSGTKAQTPGQALPPSLPPPSTPDDEVLTALGHELVDLDTLQARCGWPTAALQAALVRLELNDRVVRLGSGQFQRRGWT
jgi:DNA processing protein